MTYPVGRRIFDSSPLSTVLQQMPEGHLELREMLYKLVSELKELDPDSANTKEFLRLLLISHFSALRVTCSTMVRVHTRV
jgi:hypothetical protein